MAFWDNLRNAFANRQNNSQVQDELNNLANNIDNFNQNYKYNELANQGYDQNTINNVRQGLNGGDKYLEGFIQQNHIRTPQTQDEINLARQGQFNNVSVPQSTNQALIRGVNQSQSNTQNGERPIWRDMLASALLGIGRTPYDANRGALGSIAQGVANGARNYTNYKMAKNVFDQMGMDTSNFNVLGDYSNMTPDKALQYGIQNRRIQTNQEIANAKDQQTRAKMILDAFNKGSISADEASSQMKLYGIDINNLQQSNDTRKANSQIELNEYRKKAIDANIAQNAQKIKILQQRVAQGNATANDRAILNQLNIENKKLMIEQNQLINQSLKNELGGGGGNIVNNNKDGWAF